MVAARLDDIYDDGEVRFARAHNVILSVWSGLPSSAQLSALRRAYRPLLSMPCAIGALAVVRPVRLMRFHWPEEMRRSLAQGLGELNGRAACSAVVIEGDGFLKAAAWSTITGVLLLARTTYHIRMFDQREDACRWVAKQVHAPEAPDRQDLHDALERLGVPPPYMLHPDTAQAPHTSRNDGPILYGAPDGDLVIRSLAPRFGVSPTHTSPLSTTVLARAGELCLGRRVIVMRSMGRRP